MFAVLQETEEMLKMLKESPTRETLTGKLEETRQYASNLRGNKPQTPKVDRMFAETEQIIDAYFNPDEFADLVEELEDEFKSEHEAATMAAGEEQSNPSAPASGGA